MLENNLEGDHGIYGKDALTIGNLRAYIRIQREKEFENGRRRELFYKWSNDILE